MTTQQKQRPTGGKQDLTELTQQLKELRDEARVRIHLGGMELRDAFAEIEREADHLLGRVAPAALHAMNDLAVRLRRLLHSLDGEQ